MLLEFDLLQSGDFPRTYTTTLFIVEEDNGDLRADFQELHRRVGDKIKAAASDVATGVGTTVDSAVPGIGTAVGVALGALARAGYDGLIALIDDGLKDEIFTPIPITVTVDRPTGIRMQSDIDALKTQKVVEKGADYDIDYDWHVI